MKSEFFIDLSEHLYSATNYIKKHTTPSREEIIIDVGGADGTTPVYFARTFPNQAVYGVEPNARMLPQLKVVALQHQSITVKPLALGRSQEATLHVTAKNLWSSLNDLDLEELAQMPPEFRGALHEDEQICVSVSKSSKTLPAFC